MTALNSYSTPLSWVLRIEAMPSPVSYTHLDTDHVASAYTPWGEFTTPAEEAVPLAVPDGIVVTVSGNEATVVWNPVDVYKRQV